VSRQADDDPVDNVEDGELEDIEETLAEDAIQESTVQPPPDKPIGKKKRSQKGGQKKRGSDKQNGKPDLRKRTWDKVDSGLGSLDYGEEEGNTETRPAAAQRRRISYEDV
jgi:hypothetical protein